MPDKQPTTMTTECLIAQMGQEIGALLRCIIQQEIQSHADRINQLQSILQAGPCIPETQSSVNTTDDSLPTSSQ